MINYVVLAYRFETCYQIALAIKKEVEDLEAAGIQVCIYQFCKFVFYRCNNMSMCNNTFFFTLCR
jgi:hypothetical protein